MIGLVSCLAVLAAVLALIGAAIWQIGGARFGLAYMAVLAALLLAGFALLF